MKKILITGADSYIGISFEKYIRENFPDRYLVDTIDMIGNGWREKSFAGYDSVLHVAGIAHQKENSKNAHLYYEVNRDLAVETAKKSKADGVGQFILFSSMSVYGMDTGVITKETKSNPKSNYGKSKLQAEQEIAPLEDKDFKVCILRPPMVYGKGCKGNYVALVKIARVLPFLPDYKNQRSMIFIDKLSENLKYYVDTNKSGLCFPQDEAYGCTCEMMEQIRKNLGKRYKTVKIMNPLIKLFAKYTKVGRKAFGDLVYKDI